MLKDVLTAQLGHICALSSEILHRGADTAEAFGELGQKAGALSLALEKHVQPILQKGHAPLKLDSLVRYAAFKRSLAHLLPAAPAENDFRQKMQAFANAAEGLAAAGFIDDICRALRTCGLDGDVLLEAAVAHAFDGPVRTELPLDLTPALNVVLDATLALTQLAQRPVPSA